MSTNNAYLNVATKPEIKEIVKTISVSKNRSMNYVLNEMLEDVLKLPKYAHVCKAVNHNRELAQLNKKMDQALDTYLQLIAARQELIG